MPLQKLRRHLCWRNWDHILVYYPSIGGMLGLLDCTSDLSKWHSLWPPKNSRKKLFNDPEIFYLFNSLISRFMKSTWWTFLPHDLEASSRQHETCCSGNDGKCVLLINHGMILREPTSCSDHHRSLQRHEPKLCSVPDVCH